VYGLVLVGALRFVVFVDSSAGVLPLPLENHGLESKFVLLAYRAQQGLSLYPDWHDYPYVANLFGPVDFLLVGWLGRHLSADIRGLFLIGRGVSFVSAILTTLLVGLWAGRRYGLGAGIAAMIIGFGCEPMNGFTTMVRPDALAELLGFAGFLMTGVNAAGALPAGVALLALSALTKQTAGVFLLAAALALTLEGERRKAVIVLAGGLATLVAVVALVTSLIEPYFARSLLGERAMPWDGRLWWALLYRVVLLCPELVLLPVLGSLLWHTDRPRAFRPAVLTVILLCASVGLSGKVGADLNYFLSLRLPAAMAVAALWHAVHSQTVRPLGWAVMGLTVLAVVGVFDSLVAAVGRVDRVHTMNAFYARPSGMSVLHSYRAAYALAQNSNVHLLTDSGLIDFYQGNRALFGDPWLFRKMVEIGEIVPRKLIAKIDAQSFDVIITVHDVDSPLYVTQDFRLPLPVIEHLRKVYVRREHRPGLYYYGRRGDVWPPPSFSLH
jgi:hypothetical protein